MYQNSQTKADTFQNFSRHSYNYMGLNFNLHSYTGILVANPEIMYVKKLIKNK